MAIKTIRNFKGIPRAYQATAKYLDKRMCKSFKSRDEAEEFERGVKSAEAREIRRRRHEAMRDALSDPRTAPLRTLSVPSVLDWHAAHARCSEPLRKVTSQLKRKLPDVLVCELTDEWTQGFCERLLRASEGGTQGGSLARNTIAGYISLIKTACARRATSLGIDCPPLGLGYEHLPLKSAAMRERRLRGDEAERILAELGRVGVSSRANPVAAGAPARSSGRHYQLLFNFAIETCSRPKEAQLIAWSEVDLEARVWRLPAERSAGRRPRPVYLSRKAVEILRELLADRKANDPLVFHRLPTIDSVARRWSCAMRRLGIEDLRLSDLRFEGMMRLAEDPAFDMQSFMAILGRSHRTASRYAFLRDPANFARMRARDEALELGDAVPTQSAAPAAEDARVRRL